MGLSITCRVAAMINVNGFAQESITTVSIFQQRMTRGIRGNEGGGETNTKALPMSGQAGFFRAIQAAPEENTPH
jgi:hypothetical protein